MSSAIFERYQKQMLLPQIGIEGQQAIKNARILVVGAGGLGCPVLMYLASAGVGTIGIVDDDRVELSNLHRQVLYQEKDVGLYKATVAANRLLTMNTTVQVECFIAHFTPKNAELLLKNYEIIIDCTDNFETHYLLNDRCVTLGKPLVHASVHQFSGHCLVIKPSTPCYRCVFPESDLPETGSCANEGVLGIVPGLLGNFQALEALKLILQSEHTLAGQLLFLDTLTLDIKLWKLQSDPDCPACKKTNSKRIAMMTTPNEINETVNILSLSSKDLRDLQEDKKQKILLIDVREIHEYERSHIPNSINSPLSQLEKLDDLMKNSNAALTVFICFSGVRSLQAAHYALKKFQLRSVANLVGGIQSWFAAEAEV